MALTSDVTGRRGQPVMPMGCMVWPGLLAASFLIGGAVAMSNWDALSGFVRAGAVAAVVVGTLLLLPVLLMIAFQISLGRFFRQMSEIEKTGYVKVHRIYRNGRSESEHDYRQDNKIVDAPPQLPQAE